MRRSKMAGSDVRSIEALETFHNELVRYASGGDITLQELRMLIGRAEEHFLQSRPAYWRNQLRLAERELTEAKDSLSQKRAAARPQDRPAASEATKRVRLAQLRVNTCRDKLRLAKATAIEIGRRCDDVLGPLAEATEQCQVVLPAAAGRLRSIIDKLRDYSDDSNPE